MNGEVSSTQKIEDQETLTIQAIEDVISDKPQLKDISTQATNASENIDLKVFLIQDRENLFQLKYFLI